MNSHVSLYMGKLLVYDDASRQALVDLRGMSAAALAALDQSDRNRLHKTWSQPAFRVGVPQSASYTPSTASVYP